jgi:hypothetical protein
MKRYMNQPKINAPTTMMRNRERPYLQRAFLSFRRMRASTTQTKEEYTIMEILIVPADESQYHADKGGIHDHGEEMALEDHGFFPMAMS